MAMLPGGGGFGAADLFTLQATLGLNTNPYETGINGAMGLFTNLENLIGQGLNLAIHVAWDFVGDVFSHGLGLDAALRDVYAVSQTTDEEGQNILRNAAIAEAAVSSLTGADVALVEYYQALAGINDPQEIANNIHGIVVAIEASGEDVKTVSDIVTDIANVYQIDTEHAADVLAAAATNANTTITQVGKALQFMGPLAAALGFSLEDSVIQLGLSADKGIKSGMAGRGIRNIITRVGTDAGKTSTKLGALEIVTDKLGVSFYDAAGNARDFNTFISEARDAWQGLNEPDRNAVLEQFGEIAREGANVDTVLKELNEDAALVQSLAQQAAGTKILERAEEYENQIKDITDQYTALFELLGIPMPQTPNDYANALDQAQIKLGLLTDQEKIYFANQIANRQGMSTWLALMETGKDDADELTTAIYNATGAAQEMRDIRLGSNLAGDIDSFSAAYDALLDTIYGEVNGPIRGIVQEGTTGINAIREAIEKDGLQGGLDELAKQIGIFSKKVEPVVAAVGKALAPIVTQLVKTFENDILPVATRLGTNFAKGLLEGFDDTGDLGPVSSFLVGLANNALGGFNIGSEQDKNGGVWQIISGILGGISNTVTGGIDGGTGLLTHKSPIQPFELNKEQFKTDMENEIPEALRGWSAAAGGDTKSTPVGGGRFSLVLGADPDTASFETAGTEGGAYAGVNMEETINQSSDTVASHLESAIGDAGTEAGHRLSDNIQAVLDSETHTIHLQVITDDQSLPVQHNARAMTGGRIFKRPTIFGYAEGSYQVAGDAGPEAVVGVNSLYGMISQAVDNTMGQRMEYTEPLTTPEPTYYESTSGTVERMTNYGSDSASSAIANTVSAIYEVVQSIPRALETMAVADPTMNTLAAMNGVAQRILPALDSVTGAIDNAIFSNTEAVILSGDSVASTISGTITTYADMMMATMADILTAVRICASKNNNASMEMDGTTFARVFLPYLNREQQRLGVNLSKGAAL